MRSTTAYPRIRLLNCPAAQDVAKDPAKQGTELAALHTLCGQLRSALERHKAAGLAALHALCGQLRSALERHKAAAKTAQLTANCTLAELTSE